MSCDTCNDQGSVQGQSDWGMRIPCPSCGGGESSESTPTTSGSGGEPPDWMKIFVLLGWISMIFFVIYLFANSDQMIYDHFHPEGSAQTTIFTVGNRTYEIVPFLKETYVLHLSDEIKKLAIELDANLGKDECEYILKHRIEMPNKFRGKIRLIFADWSNPSNSCQFARLSWNRGFVSCWQQDWHIGFFFGDERLVRRVK